MDTATEPAGRMAKRHASARRREGTKKTPPPLDRLIAIPLPPSPLFLSFEYLLALLSSTSSIAGNNNWLVMKSVLEIHACFPLYYNECCVHLGLHLLR